MFDEINALIGAVATALEIGEMEVITAIEQGRLGLEMLTDDQGRNYIDANLDGKNARVYPGAVFRPAAAKPKPEGWTPDIPSRDDEPQPGHGDGCSCGR